MKKGTKIHSPCPSPTWLGVVGHLSPPMILQVVPLALLLHHPQHPLEWLCHQYWNPWTGEDHQYLGHGTEIPALLGRTYSRMRNHYLPNIILYSELSIGHWNKGVSKIWYKKKSLGTCHINHHWWSSLGKNCDHWYLTTNHVVSSFENIHKTTFKDKRHEEELQHYAIKPWGKLQLQLLKLSHMGLVSHEHACNQCRPPPFDLHSQNQTLINTTPTCMHTILYHHSIPDFCWEELNTQYIESIPSNNTDSTKYTRYD